MSGVFNCYIGFGNFSIGYEQLIQSVIAGQRQLPRHRGNNRLCSYGIAAGFITYCIVKTCKKEAKSVHPIIWIVSLLFILNFILLAVL